MSRSRPTETTAFDLDHIFVCVGEDSRADRAIAALSEFGLDLSTRRVHRGQGTRNACAFFDNAYLELLCRADDVELGSDAVAPLMLRERLRWRETGACPFGVSVRPVDTDADHTVMETWAYTAPYLREGTSIQIVTPRNTPDEPLVFLSSSPAPVDFPADTRPPLIQRGRRRRLTGLRIRIPGAATVSSAVRAVFAGSGVRLDEASGPHLELEWDAGKEGRRRDFRGVLPLSIRW